MVNDDERREVARRLREMSGWGGEVDCAEWGERVLNLLYRGGEDCTEGEYYARLADLVKPSCDRDALLALAKEMDAEGLNGWAGPVNVGEYARSIREACGVTADE